MLGTQAAAVTVLEEHPTGASPRDVSSLLLGEARSTDAGDKGDLRRTPARGIGAGTRFDLAVPGAGVVRRDRVAAPIGIRW